jgi:hypothetical protein
LCLRKTAFLRHLYIKCIILPRQARDKHGENSKKDAVFRTASPWTPAPWESYRNQKNTPLSFLSLLYVCPEPVLANVLSPAFSCVCPEPVLAKQCIIFSLAKPEPEVFCAYIPILCQLSDRDLEGRPVVGKGLPRGFPSRQRTILQKRLSRFFESAFCPCVCPEPVSVE